MNSAATELEKHSIPDAERILRVHGITTGGQGARVAREYYLSLLEAAGDDDLQAVAAHLSANTVVSASEGPWTNSLDVLVFISHLTANKVIAEWIKKRLSNYGVECFVAHSSLEVTSAWRREIEKALATCDAMIALVAPGFRESEWCDQEFGHAWGRGVPIAPVMIDGGQPHGFLADIQGIPTTGEIDIYRAGLIANQILDILLKKLPDRKKVTAVIAKRFAASSSFDDARAQFARLVSVDASEYDESDIELVMNAVKSNSQLREAGAPIGNGQYDDVPKLVGEYFDQ
jgi:hypothetical protein